MYIKNININYSKLIYISFFTKEISNSSYCLLTYVTCVIMCVINLIQIKKDFFKHSEKYDKNSNYAFFF